MDKDKRLMEASWWRDWLRGKPCLVLMGRAMLSKSLIFCWWVGLCSLSVVWSEAKLWWRLWRPPSKGPMDTLLHSVPPTLKQATPDPRLHWRLLDIYWQVWVNLLWGHCSFLLDPGAQGFVCALQESVSPVLCKFWLLYGGVNGNLLQKGLCHTQIYFPQSSCPCSRPLMSRNSAGDTHTLNGRSGSVSVGSPGVHKVWFEPSDHL